jgi:hypothetical protein
LTFTASFANTAEDSESIHDGQVLLLGLILLPDQWIEIELLAPSLAEATHF